MRFVAHTSTLRVALARESEARAVGFVHRPFVPGLVKVLAHELPGEERGLRVLRRADLAAMGVPEADVWKLAAKNGVGGPAHVSRRDTGSGAVVWGLLNGDPWVCTNIWALDELAHELPRADGWFDPVLGLIVGVPCRQAVFVHKLGTADVEAALVATTLLTWESYHGQSDEVRGIPGLDPLVPNVYWLRDGVFTHIPTAVSERPNGVAVRVEPPQAFETDVIQRVDIHWDGIERLD